MNRIAEVDAYIQALPDWQRDICVAIRNLIHEAEPEIAEEIKFTDRPYFTLQGNVCALQATKDHVNVFIYDPIAPDPHGIINQGMENATARSIQIYKDQTLDGDAFKELIAAVVRNNRAGGWRKVKNGE